MSPKSMIPVTNPASSVSVLSTLRSVWATCARNRPQTGVIRASKASSVRATAPRARGSRMSSSIARADSACWTSQSIVRRALGWKKPRIATARRAAVSPHATSAASDRSVAAMRLWPGRTS